MPKLDPTDLAILRLVQADGRMSQADLARETGISPASLLVRLRKLEQSGVITEYAAHLNGAQLGFHLNIFVMVQLELHHEHPISGFRKAVSELPEVLECHNVSGDFDYLLKVVARDMASYERFVRQKLSKIPGVGKVQSSFVLHTAKQSTRLPLE